MVLGAAVVAAAVFIDITVFVVVVAAGFVVVVVVVVVVGVVVARDAPQFTLVADTVFDSSVIAPFRATTVPSFDAPASKVTLAFATMVPANEVDVPSVALDPTCQKTPQAFPPPLNKTFAPVPDMIVLPI